MRDLIDLVESQANRLGDYITASTGNAHADFWIVRRGSADTVGQPTREFNKEHIAVKVTATDALDSRYLFYMIEHVWRSGYFKGKATGSLRLVNIKVQDVLNIPVG